MKGLVIFFIIIIFFLLLTFPQNFLLYHLLLYRLIHLRGNLHFTNRTNQNLIFVVLEEKCVKIFEKLVRRLEFGKLVDAESLRALFTNPELKVFADRKDPIEHVWQIRVMIAFFQID